MDRVDDQTPEFIGAKGLQQIFVGTLVGCRLDIVCICTAGKHDYCRPIESQMIPHEVENIPSRDIWQADIEDHDIWKVFLESLVRLGTGRRRHDSDLDLLEYAKTL